MTAEALLAELADPACYPAAPRASQSAPGVQIVQTHLSIVCITGELVYKLKKPLRLPFVDFSTRELRHQACLDEVRLNRRLCPDVYLGVVALRRHADGTLRFDALAAQSGRSAASPPDEPAEPAEPAAAAIVESAVLMRRLPQDAMLDERLARGTVPQAAIAALARQLAAFHAAADSSPTTRQLGAPERLLAYAAANFAELGQLPLAAALQPLLPAVATASAVAFAALAPQLQRRAAAGRVRDGHGDLHARNICMVEPPAIYDCIEFNAELRCGDVATDLAFLAMDLRYRGRPQLATTLVREYQAASGDHELPELLPPLLAYRAMVRAKVAAIAASASELTSTAREQSTTSVHRHLALAAALLLEPGTPRWLVLCGPPACGKSSLASALADLTGWPVVATDLVRKQLFGRAPHERLDTAHYTPAATAQTYAATLSQAHAATTAGAAVVLLDGNFPDRERRAQAAAAAHRAGAALHVVHLDVDLPTALARARARELDPDRISDADAAITATRYATFEPPTADEHLPLARLDARLSTAALLAHLLAALLTATTPQSTG
jgi:aminoglycoside phosphotransferase family enzyme/predicted kinase